MCQQQVDSRWTSRVHCFRQRRAIVHLVPQTLVYIRALLQQKPDDVVFVILSRERQRSLGSIRLPVLIIRMRRIDASLKFPPRP